MIARMRAFTGGRKGATGLIVAALVGFIALTGWTFIGPMIAAVTKLSEKLPAFWERLQKPLIKNMNQPFKCVAGRKMRLGSYAISQGSYRAGRIRNGNW